MLTMSGNKTNDITDETLSCIISLGIVVGRTASMLNGYSYDSPLNPLKVYTPLKGLDWLRTSARNFVYLRNYNDVLGIDCNVPNPERTICDFLMYPRELAADLHILDAMEGYFEEHGSFDGVYDMMKVLGIPRVELDNWIPHMWDGSNWRASD